MWPTRPRSPAFRDALAAAKPDVVLIVGDDHKEVFKEDNMPSVSVYWGETIPYKPQGMMKWKYDPSLQADSWYPQEEKDLPGRLPLRGATDRRPDQTGLRRRAPLALLTSRARA